MKQFSRRLMIVVLTLMIFMGSCTLLAEAAPLWYINYLNGKTTPAGDGANQVQPTVPDNDDPSTDNWWEDSDYWRNKYRPNQKPPTPTPTPNPEPDPDPVTPNPDLPGIIQEEKILLELLNAERVQRGLQPLRSNSTLVQLARTKAQDMAVNNYFSHTSPTYGKAADMVKRAGLNYWIVGENLALTTTGSRANALFMGSSSHKATRLSKHFTEVGIGMYRKENGSLYVAEIFIGTR